MTSYDCAESWIHDWWTVSWLHFIASEDSNVRGCTNLLNHCFYVGLYNELLIINFISSCMAPLMGLLMESLFGIFQKKCMKMKIQCDWYAILKFYEWNIHQSIHAVVWFQFVCRRQIFKCATDLLKLFVLPYVLDFFSFSVLSLH